MSTDYIDGRHLPVPDPVDTSINERSRWSRWPITMPDGSRSLLWVEGWHLVDRKVEVMRFLKDNPGHKLVD